jgi:hypothetical protein
VRCRYWKNQAYFNNLGKFSSTKNIALARKGLAPLDNWGQPIELHHILARRFGGTNAFVNLMPLTRSAHRKIHYPWLYYFKKGGTMFEHDKKQFGFLLILWKEK